LEREPAEPAVDRIVEPHIPEFVREQLEREPAEPAFDRIAEPQIPEFMREPNPEPYVRTVMPIRPTQPDMPEPAQDRSSYSPFRSPERYTQPSPQINVGQPVFNSAPERIHESDVSVALRHAPENVVEEGRSSAVLRPVPDAAQRPADDAKPETIQLLRPDAQVVVSEHKSAAVSADSNPRILLLVAILVLVAVVSGILGVTGLVDFSAYANLIKSIFGNTFGG
jgi:hypothetical protein